MKERKVVEDLKKERREGRQRGAEGLSFMGWDWTRDEYMCVSPQCGITLRAVLAGGPLALLHVLAVGLHCLVFIRKGLHQQEARSFVLCVLIVVVTIIVASAIARLDMPMHGQCLLDHVLLDE